MVIPSGCIKPRVNFIHMGVRWRFPISDDYEILPGGRWMIKNRNGFLRWAPHPSILPNPPPYWLQKKSKKDPAIDKLDKLTSLNLDNYWKEIVSECRGEPRVITYSG